MSDPGPHKAPKLRLMIKQDQEILREIPKDQITRRTELQHTIDVRIDDLINATATGRSLREEAAAYKGNWRDIVLFLCVLFLCVTIFGYIWWNVPHSRTNWLAINALPQFMVSNGLAPNAITDGEEQD